MKEERKYQDVELEQLRGLTNNFKKYEMQA